MALTSLYVLPMGPMATAGSLTALQSWEAPEAFLALDPCHRSVNFPKLCFP